MKLYKVISTSFFCEVYVLKAGKWEFIGEGTDLPEGVTRLEDAAHYQMGQSNMCPEEISTEYYAG